MDTTVISNIISRGRFSAPQGGEAEPMRAALEEVLIAESNQQQNREDRRDMRHPFPKLIRLTPVDSQGQTILDDAITVVGSNLSVEGINFFCKEPIPFRRVIVSIPQQSSPDLHVLVDLKWCRFVGGGWFDNGGKFINLVKKTARGFLVLGKERL